MIVRRCSYCAHLYDCRWYQCPQCGHPNAQVVVEPRSFSIIHGTLAQSDTLRPARFTPT